MNNHNLFYERYGEGSQQQISNAMFITRNKLFLRSCLVTAKRARVSKFPVMIRTEEKKYALKNTIPSALGGKLLANRD